jgi:hypothetical protein
MSSIWLVNDFNIPVVARLRRRRAVADSGPHIVRDLDAEQCVTPEVAMSRPASTT